MHPTLALQETLLEAGGSMHIPGSQWRCWLLTAGNIALLLIAAQSLTTWDAAAAQEPVQHVRLQLKWFHQFQFAGFYIALEQGYYRDAGIEVDILEGRPDVDPDDVVLSGQAEFGIGNSALLLDRGKGKPVTAVAVLFQHSPFVLLARPGADLKDVTDLPGKTLMLEAHAAELEAYLASQKVPMDAINRVMHTGDPLVLGRGVDAISAYTTTEPYDLSMAGVPFQVFNPRASGIDFYGDTLFTTEQIAHSNRDLVLAFREASLKGWRYALDHPDETIDLILAKYAPHLNRGKLEYEAHETRRLMVADVVEIGYMHEGRWRHIADGFSAAGLMPHDLPLDGFLFELDSRPDLRWLYAILVGTGVTTLIVSAVLGRFHILNRRLNRGVAERRRVEQELVAARDAAEAAVRAKSRFLANMSYELRTPLNAVLGFSEIVRDQTFGPKAISRYAEYGGLIHTGASHLLEILNDILDLSKIEADKLGIEPRSIEVGERLNAAVNLMRERALTKGQTITVEIAPDIDTCWADERAFKQIVFNLLSNAIKFTPQCGRITVVVACGDSGDVRITVRDTGIGIPAEEIGRILQPFEQIENSYTRSQGGTGLGLSLVKALIELHGGDIRLDSAVGVGTAVTIHFPPPPPDWTDEPEFRPVRVASEEA
jgi:signal transduction histidine kinase